MIFRTKYELYEYQVMLFELTNASIMFQELINHMLYDHLNEFVIAYLNDILIFFKTKKKHEKHVKKNFKNFQEIKKKFKKELILIHYDYEKSVNIDANASEHIMKTCLQQLNDQE